MSFRLPARVSSDLRNLSSAFVFQGCLSVLFIKKREHRIKADLFQILQGFLGREGNCRRLKKDRFKPKGEFVCETEN